jgi:putative ABC transport system permease protein
VLGVTFVSGTLVLTDTLNRTFDTLIGTAYAHINFEIRGRAAFGDNTASAANRTTDRKPIPESIAAEVRRVPGVEDVDGSVSGYAQFVSGGDAVGDAGSALGFSFDPDPKLSSVRLVAGRAPAASDELVMDKGTATKNHFKVGDRVRVLLGTPPEFSTITGIVTFGSAALRQAAADRSPRQGAAGRRAGRPRRQQVPRRLRERWGPDARAVRIVAASQGQSGARPGLRPAGLAVVVALIGIVNTLLLSVFERTHELGLLRAVGIKRGQVRTMIRSEAIIIALFGAVIGVLMGTGLGVAFAASLKQQGITVQHVEPGPPRRPAGGG